VAAFGSRPGIAAAAAGLAILCNAAVARLILRADDTFVYVLGHRVNWVCSLRSRFGLPCPTCGMTRSVVLSLHGHPVRAWHLAAGGPVAVYGLIAFSAILLLLAWFQWNQQSKSEAAARLWIRRSALVYAGIAVVIWLGGWAASLSAALRSAAA
jgi:hypothetical protein